MVIDKRFASLFGKFLLFFPKISSKYDYIYQKLLEKSLKISSKIEANQISTEPSTNQIPFKSVKEILDIAQQYQYNVPEVIKRIFKRKDIHDILSLDKASQEPSKSEKTFNYDWSGEKYKVESSVSTDIYDKLKEKGDLKKEDVDPDYAPKLFFNACIKGDHELVKKLIDIGVVGANTKMQFIQRSALIYAVEYAPEEGCKEVVHVLLNAGANPNYTDRDKNGALIFAVQRGDEEIVEALLNAGASPILKTKEDVSDAYNRDNDKNTVLMIAAREGKVEIVQKLLAAGANINNQISTEPKLFSMGIRIVAHIF